jgi:hypothetical protein
MAGKLAYQATHITTPKISEGDPVGLTIHYNLETKVTAEADVRRLVEGLRQFALDLPFQQVEEVVEFKGKYVTSDDQDDPCRWLKIQAGRYLTKGQYSYPVAPLHIMAFTTNPGEGCEPASFGFCRYPERIVDPQQRKRRIHTDLLGWSWQSFCKTQYASDPACGGVANFLRCHLCVIKLLDFAKKTGLIEVEVSDEGGYWEERNLETLAKQVANWNEMIAAFAGQMKEAAQALGLEADSAIASFQNFEHLEAKGLERFKDLGLFRDP